MQFSPSDLLFLVETVMPERSDKEHAASLIGGDPEFVEALLNHERVFERLVGDEETWVKISPRLFFSVLLRRAARDLENETYTMERRQRQSVAIFDAGQAAKLLGNPSVRDYLADMLASFTRVHSYTWRVRVRKGVWHRQRFNDLDIDSLIRYCNSVDEEHRFEVYRRIADVCLFLAGMFPEHIESQLRYPASHAPRPGLGRVQRSIEDYEREGRAFYSLAAGHRAAHAAQWSAALSTLAESFTLAEKPLAFIANHYLHMRKQALFGL